MKSSFSERCRRLKKQLEASELDALLVTKRSNWYYLTGFTGDAGALVVSRKGITLITDGRFTVQAKAETAGIRVVLQKKGLYEDTGEVLKRQGDKRIGFDPQQLSVAHWKTVRRASQGAGAWIASGGLVETLRMRKESAELAAMRKAALLAGGVLEGVLKLVKPGVRETEIGAEIEYQMRKKGAEGVSFESIVASGPRSALPHAHPTAKRLRKNELVVLDLGAILQHYCSDITRTIYVGRTPPRIRKWYQAVKEAQQAAIAAIRPGALCGEVDAAARQVLAGYGLDQYFVHSTGHGLGLEVHEEPRLARGQKRKLEAGNVITIEPGVYVAGVGGIRIEDDVLVTATGSEVLTRVTRDLIEL
ncbi:MAG TPA: Xaa-Pro peptidase family protein [Candidatus Eremiobacteraceae bacterium]|nr:Xaa-Pro peptidase family protein [Candidatus Eremiobacteraceae bacterium]